MTIDFCVHEDGFEQRGIGTTYCYIALRMTIRETEPMA
jgi:hypothetical protein